MVAVAPVTAVVLMATVTFRSLMRCVLAVIPVRLRCRCRFVLSQIGAVVMGVPGVVILGGGFHRVASVSVGQSLLIHATMAV